MGLSTHPFISFVSQGSFCFSFLKFRLFDVDIGVEAAAGLEAFEAKWLNKIKWITALMIEITCYFSCCRFFPSYSQ